MKLKLKQNFAAAVLALSLGATAANAASVTASVSSGEIVVGDVFSISLTTDPATSDFVGFQTSLSWDAAAVNLTEITYLPAFDTVSPSPDDTLTNPIFVTAGSIFETLTGEQTLATFVFEALAVGVSEVTFGDPNSDGGFLTSTTGTSLFDGPVSTTVSISSRPTDPPAIPLPASGFLLIAGLAGVASLKRRQ